MPWGRALSRSPKASCCSVDRYDDARVWFAQAATWFDAALEPENAKDCRTRSGAVDLDLAADLDSESEHELRIAADPKSEPFARAKALVRLAELVGKASDAFEADRNAEAAVNQLKLAAFDDPESGPSTSLSTAGSLPRPHSQRALPSCNLSFKSQRCFEEALAKSNRSNRPFTPSRTGFSSDALLEFNHNSGDTDSGYKIF
jgi:hypothetical protein